MRRQIYTAPVVSLSDAPVPRPRPRPAPGAAPGLPAHSQFLPADRATQVLLQGFL